MYSPMGMLENSSIKFRIQAQRLVENESGNMEPAVLFVDVKCFLQQKKQQNKGDRLEIPGININAFDIEGQCTDPMVIPDGVKTCEWYECDFSGSKGKFFLLDPINPPFGRSGVGALLEESIGTKIVGIFQSGRLTNAN